MSSIYLISPAAAAELRAARAQQVAPERIEAFGRRRASGAGGTPEILQVVDGVAQITVHGVLTAEPDIWAWLFAGGNTTYSDIQTSLRLAAADPAVREVLLLVSSPGGEVDGLFELLLDMSAFAKPIRARASTALSAAYGIAAAAGSIEATTAASRFGSVGVATAMYIDDSVVHLTNTDSAAKRPDPSTDAGKAVVQAELDAVFDLFADAIARGRNMTSARVRADFGKGATLLAGQALSAGMIDSITPAPTRSPAPGAGARAAGESLGALLAQPLPGETDEQTIARVQHMVELISRPAPVAPPTPAAPTAVELAAAVDALMTGMPEAYPFGVPAEASVALEQAMAAMPPAFHVPDPTPTDDPSPEALAAAIERETSLTWSTPPRASASAAPAPAFVPTPELAAAIAAEMAREPA